MTQNFETQGCQWYGVKKIKFIFADKENSGTSFRAHLFITSSSSYFFNKTDFKRYRFKVRAGFEVGSWLELDLVQQYFHFYVQQGSYSYVA